MIQEIFWIEGTSPARLAIVLRPRGGDWLEDELLRMKQSGVEAVVSLLEDDEGVSLGLEQEGAIARQLGLQFLTYPIPDRTTPEELRTFHEFVSGLANILREGKGIGIHCRGSIGRATITAACVLIHHGWTAYAALAAIENARGCTVPDTPEQRQWILNYKAQP